MCITVNAGNPQCCFAGVRELASLTSPWYFGAVPLGNASAYADSWHTAFDPDGAPSPTPPSHLACLIGGGTAFGPASEGMAGDIEEWPSWRSC